MRPHMFMPKRCGCNKALLLGPNSLLNLQIHLCERKRKVHGNPLCVNYSKAGNGVFSARILKDAGR